MNTGAHAELFALNYLRQRGLKLIAQNYRCRFGEIDLILEEQQTLVFVEVRLRNSIGYGGAAASIDTRKQHKLISTAQHYLTTLARTPPCRFDAILMTSSARQTSAIKKANNGENLSPEFKDSDIEWIKNAFDA